METRTTARSAARWLRRVVGGVLLYMFDGAQGQTLLVLARLLGLSWVEAAALYLCVDTRDRLVLLRGVRVTSMLFKLGPNVCSMTTVLAVLADLALALSRYVQHDWPRG